MTLAIVPHVPSPSGSRKLHLWVGVADSPAMPALSWKLDGVAKTPTEVRALAPVLSGEFTGPGAKTVLSGFYEFSDLEPDSIYEIELAAGTDRIVRSFRTLPASVPFGTQEQFNVLLVSCFHRLEDKTGNAGRVLSQLRVRPHLTLFMGDQVYLDLPTLQNFRDNKQWLADKFQNDYVENWFGDRLPPPNARIAPAGFPQILSLAPSAFVPDDHEYWNNYPFRSPFIENSWTPEGRERWKDAAEMSYRGFQQSAAIEFGQARTIVIDPLSIFVLDTRSRRDMSSRARSGDLLGHSGRRAFTAWLNELVQSAGSDSPRFGMLVTGQSLFRSAVGTLRGSVADFEFPDYENDDRFMVSELERVTGTGLPVLCVTGDVHWGRMVRAAVVGGNTAPIYEVISSPTSLVSTVFADQAKEIWGGLRGFVGSRDRWPRHDDPDRPPDRFGTAQQYATEVLQRPDGKPAGMRGNHAVMLRFARAGNGLDVEATYYPLHSDDGVNTAEQWSARLRLRPTR